MAFQIVIICDKCGKKKFRTEEAEGVMRAITRTAITESARLNGWKVTRKIHLCPDCKGSGWDRSVT